MSHSVAMIDDRGRPLNVDGEEEHSSGVFRKGGGEKGMYFGQTLPSPTTTSHPPSPSSHLPKTKKKDAERKRTR